jgi:hypothetical protein
LAQAKLPPVPYVNPHHNRRGPFTKKDWLAEAGKRKGKKPVVGPGGMALSRSMPSLRGIGQLSKPSTSKSASASTHQLAPINVVRSRRGLKNKPQHHGKHGHGDHHAIIVSKATKVKTAKEKRVERQKYLKERQSIRRGLCGHFPAFYDLPRMLSILAVQEGKVKDMVKTEEDARRANVPGVRAQVGSRPAGQSARQPGSQTAIH